jgi:hypothetical protein
MSGHEGFPRTSINWLTQVMKLLLEAEVDTGH